MSRRNHHPVATEATIESLEGLNHYQVLGLTEAARSEEIKQSLHVERWPWHLVEEGAREFATRKRVEAYGVLNDPATRAAFDKQQGYSKGHLAARIGDETSVWGQTWLILFAIIEFIMVIGGPYHPARAIGSAFAPDFKEVFVRSEPQCALSVPCEASYRREFQSSSDLWQKVLNGWLPWVVPPVVAAGVGLALRPVVGRVAGYAVASVRYAGRRDGLTRVLMLVLTAILPITFLVLYLLLPPDAVQQPPVGLSS